MRQWISGGCAAALLGGLVAGGAPSNAGAEDGLPEAGRAAVPSWEVSSWEEWRASGRSEREWRRARKEALARAERDASRERAESERPHFPAPRPAGPAPELPPLAESPPTERPEHPRNERPAPTVPSNPVPEPAAVLAFGVGALIVGAAVRRSRSAAA